MNALALLAVFTLSSQASIHDAGADAIISSAEERLVSYVDAAFVNGLWEEILPILRLRYSLHPDDYEVMTDLGFILQNAKKESEALTIYRRYETDSPNDPDRFLPRAGLYYIKKNWKEVVAALEATPGTQCHPNNLRMLAKAHEELGDYSKSVEVYEEMIRRFPSDGPAKRNLERVKNKLSEPSKPSR